MHVHNNICGNALDVRITAMNNREFNSWRLCCPDLEVDTDDFHDNIDNNDSCDNI
eukprot:Pgem_evm1s9048